MARVGSTMATIPAVSSRSAEGSISTVGIYATQDAFRGRISRALSETDRPVSGEWEDAESAIATCREHTPDLMVVGAPRPSATILETISELIVAVPTMRVVIACDRSAAGDIRKALDAGVHGVVLADELEDVLDLVLSVVSAGQVSVPCTHRKEARERVLTGREKQVLGLVVMGMTNAQIASKLFLAESTIKSHLSSSFAKLGVASRNEAVGLILDPTRGQGLGILTIPAEKLAPRLGK
jgi:two-component system response regulator DesR